MTAWGQVEPPAAYPPTYAGASAVPRIADSVDPQVKVVKVVGLVPGRDSCTAAKRG